MKSARTLMQLKNIMNQTEIDEEVMRNYGNYLLAKNAIPNIIITILYLFLGIVGNSFVIYVYAFATKSHINNKYFILVLAIVDIVSCIVNCIFTIVLDLMQLTFRSTVFCKLLRVFCHVTALTSAFILLVIAIQRYLLVCRPLGNQMTLGWRRFCVFMSVVLSAVLGFPAVIFYGTAPVTHLGFNGTACKYEEKFIGSKDLAIYNGVFMLVCVSGIITIFALYFLVVRQIYRQRQKFPRTRQNSNKDRTNANDLSLTDSENASESRVISNAGSLDRKSNQNLRLNCFSKNTTHVFEGNESTTDSEMQPETGLVKTDSGSTKQSLKRNNSLSSIAKFSVQRKSKQMKASLKYHRFSLMFVTITLVCVISFMPLRSLEFLEVSNKDFVENTFGSYLPLYRFLYTSYILNNIANPFIYGLFDKEFRKRLKNIFYSK